MYEFNAKEHLEHVIQSTKDWFVKNGEDCNAVVAISGGADSSIVAAILVEALGRERVYGILMPDGEQKDLQDAKDLVTHLEIKYDVCDISELTHGVVGMATLAGVTVTGELNITEQCRINIAPRIRMAVARAIAQNINGRYINTCNLSEDWVGYFTIDGDGTGDWGPLKDYTKTEAKKMGRIILPARFVDKPPADGLTDKTDEENFGFTYETDLDPYIRTGEIENLEAKAKIDQMHKANQFKINPMAKCESGLPIMGKYKRLDMDFDTEAGIYTSSMSR